MEPQEILLVHIKITANYTFQHNSCVNPTLCVHRLQIIVKIEHTSVLLKNAVVCIHIITLSVENLTGDIQSTKINDSWNINQYH